MQILSGAATVRVTSLAHATGTFLGRREERMNPSQETCLFDEHGRPTRDREVFMCELEMPHPHRLGLSNFCGSLQAWA